MPTNAFTATIAEYCNILHLVIIAALQQLHCINPPIRGDIIAVAVRLVTVRPTALMQRTKNQSKQTMTHIADGWECGRITHKIKI